MTPQALAAALIRTFEGCKLLPYRDGGGLLTVGFGHRLNLAAIPQGLTWTGSDFGGMINYETAVSLLTTDAAPLFELVKDEPMIAQAAYVSFGYNCGRSVLELVLAGKADMQHFIHDRHGNVEPGLVARRALEAALIEAAGTKEV